MGSRYVVSGGGGGGGEDLAVDLERGIRKIDEVERPLCSSFSDEQVKLLHAGRKLSHFADGQLPGDEESKNNSSGIIDKKVAGTPIGKASSLKHQKPPRHPKSSSVGSVREVSRTAKSKRRTTNKRPRKTNNCDANLGAWIVTLAFCIIIIRQVLS